MRIYKWCKATQAVIFMDINITEEELCAYESGLRLDVVAPHLTKEERDFILGNEKLAPKRRRVGLFLSR
jgi:hypothetical protein